MVVCGWRCGWWLAKVAIRVVGVAAMPNVVWKGCVVWSALRSSFVVVAYVSIRDVMRRIVADVAWFARVGKFAKKHNATCRVEISHRRGARGHASIPKQTPVIAEDAAKPVAQISVAWGEFADVRKGLWRVVRCASICKAPAITAEAADESAVRERCVRAERVLWGIVLLRHRQAALAGASISRKTPSIVEVVGEDAHHNSFVRERDVSVPLGRRFVQKMVVWICAKIAVIAGLVERRVRQGKSVQKVRVWRVVLLQPQRIVLVGASISKRVLCIVEPVVNVVRHRCVAKQGCVVPQSKARVVGLAWICAMMPRIVGHVETLVQAGGFVNWVGVATKGVRTCGFLRMLRHNGWWWIAKARSIWSDCFRSLR